MGKSKPIYLFKIFIICTIVQLLSTNNLFGQISKKEIAATRIEKPPKIDGKLDDDAWLSPGCPGTWWFFCRH